MNETPKHQNVSGQLNRQTADRTANASVFLFFPTAHFLKTILASRTNGTFGFARHTSQRFAKPKEPLLRQRIYLKHVFSPTLYKQNNYLQFIITSVR